ncbi:FecCD family ABC transporter permease [Phenylobacterium kunshanense]|uniref:Iron ABC transporter permease n=1 Tax=Phenylobacterium kunshanense TaxID=1445034 RepID=A0A328B7I9_9CAUL|nr:iron ABC transporter permease [Phenylobacterium kunshanense]RAK63093.1 iron ABC transporter permease [Phenylobacterium kunshanense]
MRPWILNAALGATAIGLAAAGLMLGETALSVAQFAEAFADPASGPHEILFDIRLPRTVAALVVGAALGLAGAVMQGLLRNPLADPGVLGVSGGAGLGAALAISLGLAARPGAVEAAALGAALLVGAALTWLAARFREPETLILFGVALSAFLGALTSLVFNFAPSPVTLAEVFAWLLGSVANRDWDDIGRQLPAMAVGAALCLYAARGLVMLTLGDEAAALSGLPMRRMRAAAVAGASLLTGAAVALAGIVGFVGLAAPHLVRAGAGGDPGRVLLPSALAGAVLLGAADIGARILPTDIELKLGVMTALAGAPLFALIAWRAARSWRG